MVIVVRHQSYGCECGCCGHVIEVDGVEKKHYFEHPYGEDARVFAEQLVARECGEEHVKDLDWANCRIDDEC